MNEQFLQQCLLLIEEKLGWGSSADWLNQDFQLLSEQIFEETRVRLSITTLKRVWGKVNYDSVPSISTLNTLATFIGYENWSAFKQQQQAPRYPEKRTFKYSKPGIAAALIVLLASTAALLAFSGKNRLTPYSESDLAHVRFSSKPVTLGLPNSVVFQYDYANLEAESTLIQQSWNDKFSFAVKRDGKEATGIYYYPGYFKAKLVADGHILREHDIHIKTKGWLATIGESDVPRYLYAHEIQDDGILKLSQLTLEGLYALEREEAPLLTYHFYDDFGEVPGDHFQFETRFRNTYQKSNGICQKVTVMVQGKNTVLIIPFSIPGCISDLSVFLMGQNIDGKSHDLSAFGTDITRWQDLKCKVNGNQVQVYLNGELIREFTSTADLGDIVGFKYRFMGAGEIDYVKLSGPEGVVLEEDFEQTASLVSQSDD